MPIVTAADVHEFWFAGTEQNPAAAQARTAWWFGGGEAVDQEIRDRFAGTVEAAGRGLLDGWSATPQGALALVLALDQFPRNIYRGMPAAFAFDAKAAATADAAITAGHLGELGPIERAFLYLPFQHAENLDAQTRSVALYEDLAATAEPGWRELLEVNLKYAREHRDIIARFGRFPHRNAILGRASQPEEEAFLAAGGPDFGQAPVG
jgi:uncharacterized protein (DUF924 family)